MLDCSRDLKKLGSGDKDPWAGFLAEGVAYIEMALEPEVQRIVEVLIANGILKPLDPNIMARLLNGAALNAALWVAASETPTAVLPKATAAFLALASGFLKSDE